MIAVPAVDVRGGRCVQLVGGRPEDERVSLPDPAAVARRWWDEGFRTLHVVDLDAALGAGRNREAVRAVLEATSADVQVGGGIRDTETAEELLEEGADRIVVGTRALQDSKWLEGLSRSHPGRVVVAADVRDGRILTKGWTQASDLEVESFLPELGSFPLAGVLCTDVGREGRMTGVDRSAVRRVLDASPFPVWISGGIGSLEDLRTLKELGAHRAVLGMSLYTGALEARTVAREFGG